MIDHRGTKKAKINYNSKENRALIDQHLHKAKVLLTINDSSNKSLLNVEGYFNVKETRRDSGNHKEFDSVVLERIDLKDNNHDGQLGEMSNEEYLDWFKSLPRAEQFQIVFEYEEFALFSKEINEKYETKFDNGRLKTTNTAGKARSAWLSDIYTAISTIYQNYELFKTEIIKHEEYSSKNLDKYVEAPFRKGYETVFSVEEFDEIYGWATETNAKLYRNTNKTNIFYIRWCNIP